MPLLDDEIQNHVDKIDEIEEQIDRDIDTLVGSIDIDVVLADPETALMSIVADLEELITTKYNPMVEEEANRFNSVISRMRNTPDDFVIPNSKDPKLNEELDDDKRSG